MNSIKFLSVIGVIVSLLLVFGSPEAYSANTGGNSVTGLILKVEGKGNAQVRRKSGVTVSAGKQLELFPGDKIITDRDSMVELGLVDGTVVKVGTNTEYKFESASPKKGFLYHAFELTKGTVRAIVEKQTEKKSVKFRINTPSGTMGVRGTEILLNHNPSIEQTSLFLIEGVAIFGNPNCEKEKICIEVKGGEWSKIRKGQKHPSKPEPYKAEDLLAVGSVEGGKTEGESSAKDASLLEILGIKKSKSELEKMQAKDLAALLEEATNKLRSTQNELLGRDEEFRKAMEAAVADGTFDEYMRLAERYDDIKSNSKKNRTNERLSAIAKVRKFSLAKSMLSTGKVRLSGAAGTPSKMGESDQASLTAGSEATINGVEPKAGEGSVQDKIAEANEISLKLNTQPTTTDAKTVDQLDPKTVEEMAKEEIVSKEYKKYYETFYYYDKCGFFEFFCGDEYFNGDWYEKESAKSEMTETKTVTKTSGVCYETRKVCGNILKPCDLSQGKFCTPTWVNECKIEKKVVTCPN